MGFNIDRLKAFETYTFFMTFLLNPVPLPFGRVWLDGLALRASLRLGAPPSHTRPYKFKISQIPSVLPYTKECKVRNLPDKKDYAHKDRLKDWNK
jgi:hypothetical protein